MKIIIETIPHREQRYPTVGDWFFNDKEQTLNIKVSNLNNTSAEACIAVHELIEAVLCRLAGVTEADVDAFDKLYESERKPGDTSEPGDSPYAPYEAQHSFASGIERLFATQLGIKWSEYERTINELE